MQKLKLYTNINQYMNRNYLITSERRITDKPWRELKTWRMACTGVNFPFFIFLSAGVDPMKTPVVCNCAVTWATISERNSIFLSRILGKEDLKSWREWWKYPRGESWRRAFVLCMNQQKWLTYSRAVHTWNRYKIPQQSLQKLKQHWNCFP